MEIDLSKVYFINLPMIENYFKSSIVLPSTIFYIIFNVWPVMLLLSGLYISKIACNTSNFLKWGKNNELYVNKIDANFKA